MGIATKIMRLERAREPELRRKATERQRHLEFVSMLERDHVRLCPEYRHVTREDCPDEEAWNDIRHTLAMADGDFGEAKRLEALPAPRRAAHEAWVKEEPNPYKQIARLGVVCTQPDPAHEALAKARERTGIQRLGYG